MTFRRLCVFAGSSHGADPAYAEAALALAATLVDRDIGMVYGGAQSGLMGVTADAVLERGGEVMGVIPTGLGDREIAHPGLSDRQGLTMRRDADLAVLAAVACGGGARFRPGCGRPPGSRQGAFGDQLGDPDRRPGRIRRRDVAVLDGGERGQVLAQADVVGGHLDDLAHGRARGLQIAAQVHERLLELGGRVRGDVAVGVRAGDAGQVQPVAVAHHVREVPVGLEPLEARHDHVVRIPVRGAQSGISQSGNQRAISASQGMPSLSSWALTRSSDSLSRCLSPGPGTNG